MYYMPTTSQNPIRGRDKLKSLVVSDIHSNIEAFQSVLDDSVLHGGFDEIWSLGDLVGYGPDPSAVINVMRQHKHKVVVGNHDLAAIGKLNLEAFNTHACEANIWTRKQLTIEDHSFLEEQPHTIEKDEFFMCHGSPRDPIWEYVISARSALASFNYFDTYRCLVGHSHIPFVCRPEGVTNVKFQSPNPGVPLILHSDRMIINPGSVGQPRDGDPRASYALYDSNRNTITHHRIAYDIKATQGKMRENNLPEFLVNRLEIGQ